MVTSCHGIIRLFTVYRSEEGEVSFTSLIIRSSAVFGKMGFSSSVMPFSSGRIRMIESQEDLKVYCRLKIKNRWPKYLSATYHLDF